MRSRPPRCTRSAPATSEDDTAAMFARWASGHSPCMTETYPQGDSPPSARPVEDDAQHGPGGMDAIEEEPVRAPDDDDAPGGMTGIPDPDDD